MRRRRPDLLSETDLRRPRFRLGTATKFDGPRAAEPQPVGSYPGLTSSRSHLPLVRMTTMRPFRTTRGILVGWPAYSGLDAVALDSHPALRSRQLISRRSQLLA